MSERVFMAEPSTEDVWFDIPGAQEYLKLSKSTLYECMKDGRLPFYYVKGTRQRRIKKTDLDKLMMRGSLDDPLDE
jgi:excisionase family DNA binding protein